MAINYAMLDEELEKRAQAISAGTASTPQYLAMQAQGLGALGDIAGIGTEPIDLFGKEQERILSGFTPKYPERLLETEKPFEWWKEKAALNSMNTIVPMLGIAVGTTMQAIPNPIAKIVGKGINWATYAATYNANLADTIQEHESIAGRELSKAEQVKAAVVAGGVSYLDMLAPARGGAGLSSAVTKTFGSGGINATKKSLQQLVNTNRQSLGKSVGIGAKNLSQIIGTEMATEAGQKALQIGSSVNPTKIGTSEGLQDILEESVIAGPMAGAVASPGSVAAGMEQNRTLTNARRMARNFNQQEKARAGMEALQASNLGELSDIDTAADLVDIPEGKGFTPPISLAATRLNKGIESATGFNTAKFANDALQKIAYKAPDTVLQARNRQTDGSSYAELNDILQMFISPGANSGETKIRNSFQQEKDNVTGEILEETSQVIDQLAQHKWFGLGGRTLDPAINTYLRDRLMGVGTSDQVKTQAQATAELRKVKPGVTNEYIQTLEAARQVFRKDLDRAYELLSGKDTGLNVAFRKNYLYKPVSSRAVEQDRQGFIDALYNATIASQVEAGVEITDALRQTTKAEVEQIARDIIDGRDTTIPDSRYLRDLLSEDGTPRTGQDKKDFEKYRSKIWEQIPDKFRENDLGVVLEQYLQRAGTRVASARTFGGKNADKLTRHLSSLKDKKAITADEANRIWDMYDASHNVYKTPQSESQERWRKVSKLGTTVGAITHLGLATFSSLPELVWTAERAGLKNTLASLPDAWNFAKEGSMRGVNKKRARSEGARALARLGFNLNPEVNERLDQLFSTDRSQILSGYFRSPFGAFLTQWTNFNRNLAVQAGQRMMNDYADNFASKSSVEKNRWLRELKEQGLTPEDWKQIVRAAKDPSTGVTNIDILNDDFLNTRMTRSLKTLGKETSEIRVRDVMMPWVHKIVEDVVVQPNPSNKPLWMSNPDFGMIAQLKTFPIVFGNTVVKRLLRKLNPKQCNPDFGLALSVLGTVMSAYAVASLAEEMKSAIKQTDPREMGIIGGANVIGLTGAAGIFGGAQYGDLSTSLLGPSLDAIINKGMGNFLSPIVSGEGTVFEGAGNIIQSVSDGILGAVGPIGLHIRGYGEEE